MKKIFLFTLLSFLLVSCGKQEGAETNSGATMTGMDMSGMEMHGVNQSGAVVTGDEQAKDPDTSVSPDNSTNVSQGNPGTSNTTTVTASGKSEDQIVKDFEKDLDGILNSIDNGNQKK